MLTAKASRLLASIVCADTRRFVSSGQLSLLRHQAYINGEYVDAEGGKTFDVLNPATGERVSSVADVPASQVAGVIKTAHDAFQTWKKTSPKERSAILRRWYELIMKHQEELATIITLENGKPLPEARGEIVYGASFVEWYAAEARRVNGEVVGSPDHRRLLTLKQPIGVVGIITPWNVPLAMICRKVAPLLAAGCTCVARPAEDTPLSTLALGVWNFPTAMMTRKVAPALAAGCTCVGRPAEDTPLSTLMLGTLATEAGIPPGVVNFVPSSREQAGPVGKVLCESPLVSCISFTGSSHVGKILLSQSASTVKRMSLELGGNAPFMVFDSADVDLAVRCFILAKFRCNGQTCVSPNRVLVQSGIHDQFVTKLGEAIDKLKVGNGLEEGVFCGPLINDKALEKVDTLVRDAVKRGANVVRGGKQIKGLLYEPTLLTGVTGEMELAKEEIFGPVAAIRKFETEKEGITLANDCRVGLAGYLYTRDMSQAWRMMEEIEVGMVSVNENSASGAEMPFGGVKESGIGRECSHYGIDEYLEVKSVAFGGI